MNLPGNGQKKPIRLMHLLGSAEAGGAEQFFLRLMIALANRPREALVLPVVREGSWISKELRRAGIRQENAGFGNLTAFMSRSSIAGVAKQWRPDVITAWMKRAASCTPVVTLTRQDAEGKEIAYQVPTTGRLGGYYDLKYFRGRVKNLIGNTPDICHWAREQGWPGERVDYLPNFVPQPAAGWKNNRGEMRTFLKIPPNGFVLFMAGRLHGVKGVDLAIEALERLEPKFHLVLVGDGPEKKKLEELARKLKVADRVHWCGWQSNISGWASAADAWLVPSRDEPLGNVVIDAWAHGIPVIASRTKGPLHLIEHGTNGRLVTTGNVIDLVSEIKEVADRRALGLQLSNGGMIAWRTKYSEDVVVDQWLEYYDRLARGGDVYE